VISAVGFAAIALAGFPPPHIVQTHSNIFGAVIFWDATAYAEKFASAGTPSKDALRAMEYEAIRIFVSRAPALARDERHLRIVASITRTSAINARYQTVRLEGAQTLFTLDGKIYRNMTFARNWQANARRGFLPAGMKLEVLASAPEGK